MSEPSSRRTIRFRRSGPPAKISKRAVLALAVGGGLALLLGIWLVIARLPGYLTTPQGETAVETAQTAPAAARKIHAQLFYVADTGIELQPVSAEVPFGETPAEQAKRIV